VDTPEARYEQLTDDVIALYEQGRQRDALELLHAADPDLAPWTAELAHTEACVYGSIDEPEAALRALKTAADAGSWWHEPILTEDDDLAALRGIPEFEALVVLSRKRRAAASNRTEDLLEVPANREPKSVVVALHGAGQRAAKALEQWAAVLDLGFALLCVESSQSMSPMYRTWPDPEHARRDIDRAITQLPDELRELPLIAAGFSAGGRAALDWALTGRPVPAAGVVVLAPAIRELPAEAAGSLSPAKILIGTADDLFEVVEGAAEQLSTLGLEIEQVPGLGHQFPQDFGNWLGTALPNCG
jgi:predicted esterase